MRTKWILYAYKRTNECIQIDRSCSSILEVDFCFVQDGIHLLLGDGFKQMHTLLHERFG